MAKIISFSPAQAGTIDVGSLVSNNRKLAAGLLTPATEDVPCVIAPEHAADPIKKMEDIVAISDYFISKGRYRDNMLFIVGINFGLRVSDLRLLRFSNLINENMVFKDSFPVFEMKTRNTRKRKKNRYVTINNAVIEAVTEYLIHTPGISLSDYLFRSESNSKTATGENEPLTARSIERILKRAADACGVSAKVSTHTLRKTFCYWIMVYGGNDPRRLLLLQRMLNHATPAQTLDYIGLTQEEVSEAYNTLNLGDRNMKRLVDSQLYETETAMA